jgi:hypothetical protein
MIGFRDGNNLLRSADVVFADRRRKHRFFRGARTSLILFFESGPEETYLCFGFAGATKK